MAILRTTKQDGKKASVAAMLEVCAEPVVATAKHAHSPAKRLKDTENRTLGEMKEENGKKERGC